MNSRQVKEIMYSLGADLYIIEACGAGGRTGNNRKTFAADHTGSRQYALAGSGSV